MTKQVSYIASLFCHHWLNLIISDIQPNIATRHWHPISQHDARIEILNRVVMWEPTQRYWTGIEVNPSPEWSPASSGPENRKKGSWTSTERVVTWLRGLAIVSGFFSALSPSGFSYRIIFIVIPRLFNRYWSRSVRFHPI